jgi:hypothetical protein
MACNNADNDIKFQTSPPLSLLLSSLPSLPMRRRVDSTGAIQL